jgi:superfamily II DNA or RNA helicase
MLRPYQSTLKSSIFQAWDAGLRNVLAVSPCGSGKTVTMTSCAADFGAPSIAIAHRAELVSQISLTFARQGLEHRIIAPNATINAVRAYHLEEVGRSWERSNAPLAIASVDTLIHRPDDPFLRLARLWQIDEAHHVLTDNKWGRVVALLQLASPSIRGLGWTATPIRTDGRSLKFGDGGVWERLICGPSMRELMEGGFLAPYQVYSLPQAIDMSNVRRSGGEYVRSDLAAAAAPSAIVGDVVEHYRRLAAGLSGVTFAISVALAENHAAAFRAAGVTAGVLHAKTPERERIDMVRAFRNGELMQVVNVDVLGEGFDMPGIRVVSMARPTLSYSLFHQQFCRPLRPMDGKPYGLVIDHVGNVPWHGARMGLPDHVAGWTLEGRPLKDDVKLRVCPECFRAYEGHKIECPFCGWRPTARAGDEGGGRSAPEEIEGDLTLYCPEMLAQLRAKVSRIASLEPQVAPGLSPIAARGAAKTWEARRQAQAALAAAIDAWAGRQKAEHGESISTLYRRFYDNYGMDTLTALAQSGPAMVAMREKINRL